MSKALPPIRSLSKSRHGQPTTPSGSYLDDNSRTMTASRMRDHNLSHTDRQPNIEVEFSLGPVQERQLPPYNDLDDPHLASYWARREMLIREKAERRRDYRRQRRIERQQREAARRRFANRRQRELEELSSKKDQHTHRGASRVKGGQCAPSARSQQHPSKMRREYFSSRRPGGGSRDSRQSYGAAAGTRHPAADADHERMASNKRSKPVKTPESETPVDMPSRQVLKAAPERTKKVELKSPIYLTNPNSSSEGIRAKSDEAELKSKTDEASELSSPRTPKKSSSSSSSSTLNGQKLMNGHKREEAEPKIEKTPKSDNEDRYPSSNRVEERPVVNSTSTDDEYSDSDFDELPEPTKQEEKKEAEKPPAAVAEVPPKELDEYSDSDFDESPEPARQEEKKEAEKPPAAVADGYDEDFELDEAAVAQEVKRELSDKTSLSGNSSRSSSRTSCAVKDNQPESTSGVAKSASSISSSSSPSSSPPLSSLEEI